MYPRVNVLLIEDDPADIAAIRQALKDPTERFQLTVVDSGEAALNVLRGHKGEPPLTRPYLILLDLYLPKMDSLQFLQELRHDLLLKTSIVFVITRSMADANKLTTYQKGIAGYVTKGKVGRCFKGLASLLNAYSAFVEFPEA